MNWPRRYVALTNNVTNVSACPSARNVLTLVTSPDLRRWTIRETLLETDEGMAQEDVWRYTSFSYVDWQFDGPDVSLHAQIYLYSNDYPYHEQLSVPRVIVVTRGTDSQK